MVCRAVVPVTSIYVVVSPSCFLEWGYPGCYITLGRPDTVYSGASPVCICEYSAVNPPQISGFPTTVQGIYILSIQLQTTYGPIRLVVNTVGMMFKYPVGLLVKLTYVRMLRITSECLCHTHMWLHITLFLALCTLGKSCLLVATFDGSCQWKNV